MRPTGVLLSLLLAAACAAPGCTTTSSTGSTSSCPHVFWYRPIQANAHVEVIGDFNAWRRPGVILQGGRDDGYLRASVDLGQGEQRYVFVEDGATVLDRTVGTTAFEAGNEVSLVEIDDCHAPSLAVLDVAQDATKVEAHLALDRSRIDPASVDAEGLPVEVDGRDLRVRWEGTALGKKRVRVRLRDVSGQTAERFVTLWRTADGQPFDPRDAIVYQILVDRYRAAGGPLTPPASPSGRAGGTLRGVTAALQAGDLDAVNTLWLSPLYQNPDGEFPGTDGREYTSYHGYWPIAARALDPRLGTEDDLRELVATAHSRGIRIVLDVVPNHVHEQHPYAKAAGFVSTGSCVCGTSDCDWASNILTCRFAPYLPDLDWTNDAVAREVTADIADWVERFDFDGIRIDAVPMMPRAASRRIADALRRRFEHSGAKLWLIGENFTGPGGEALLRYYLGPFGLDTEFHFPLMWAIRGAVGSEDQPMSAISDAFDAGEKQWAGSGAVMGLIIGNHDVSRFASLSAGTADGDGWSPAPDATDRSVFDRQLLALGLIFTLPGAPFVYYGDELALPGRGDPDSRRVMPAPSTLSSDALRVRAGFRALAKLRACAPALRRGAARFLYADRERIVFARDDADRPALVVASREPGPGVDTLAIPIPGLPEGRWVDALGSASVTVAAALTTLPAPPRSIQVFVRDGDPCLSPMKEPSP